MIAGDTTRDKHRAYADQVAARVADYRLHHRLTLAGYVPSTELMHGLDVLVSLSGGEGEGLPGVIIEAMAAGRCVVASAVAGVPEMLGGGGSGFCVAPGDIDAAASRVSVLAGDPALRQRVGRRAVGRAQSLFHRRRCAHHLEQIYRTLSITPRGPGASVADG